MKNIDPCIMLMDILINIFPKIFGGIGIAAVLVVSVLWYKECTRKPDTVQDIEVRVAHRFEDKYKPYGMLVKKLVLVRENSRGVTGYIVFSVIDDVERKSEKRLCTTSVNDVLDCGEYNVEVW